MGVYCFFRKTSENLRKYAKQRPSICANFSKITVQFVYLCKVISIYSGKPTAKKTSHIFPKNSDRIVDFRNVLALFYKKLTRINPFPIELIRIYPDFPAFPTTAPNASHQFPHSIPCFPTRKRQQRLFAMLRRDLARPCPQAQAATHRHPHPPKPAATRHNLRPAPDRLSMTHATI